MMFAAARYPPATTFPRKSPNSLPKSWRNFLTKPKTGDGPQGSSSTRSQQKPGSVPNHKIAVVAGDGIGMEVVPEGQRVLEAAGRKFGFSLAWDEKPWSCEYYQKHGEMM